MKLCKPSYYEKFECIASKCTFTCCQAWAIAVDDITLMKWHSLDTPVEMQTGNSHLSDYTLSGMGGHTLRLLENGKCPFLNPDGLCRIVLKHGEENLSRTCHTFPRERHEYSERVELALSLGCKSVLDLLWAEESFQVISMESAEETVEKWASETPKVLFMIRDWFMETASDTGIPVKRVLKILFYIMLELYEMDEHEELTEKSFSAYRSSNMVSRLDAAMQEVQESSTDTFYENNELFLDLAENYRKKQLYTDSLEPAAKRAEYYEQRQEPNGIAEKVTEFSAVWAAFEQKMRMLLCEELYASLLLPHSGLYSMVIKLEWLALEYAAIRQWMFLQWDQDKTLSDERFKDVVAVIFRMTGYSDDDIEEYLEDSFESVIWDYGYMALII